MSVILQSNNGIWGYPREFSVVANFDTTSVTETGATGRTGNGNRPRQGNYQGTVGYLQYTPKVTGYLKNDNTLVVTKIELTNIHFAYLQLDTPLGTPLWGITCDYYIIQNGSPIKVYTYSEPYLAYAKANYTVGINPSNRTIWTGNVEIPTGGSWTLDVAYSNTQGQGLNNRNASLEIRNEYSKPAPKAPTISVKATPSTANANTITFEATSYDFGYCQTSTPENTGLGVSVRTGGYDGDILTMGAGAKKVATNLAPNTRYYSTWIITNGCLSADAQVSAVTLTPNSLSDLLTPTYDTASVRLSVTNGGGVYKPTTDIYLKKCTDENWTKVQTSTATNLATINLTGLDENTCYEVQARTTTTAGTYTGNTIKFTSPKKNLCVANYTNIDMSVDEDNWAVCANFCYEWETNATPAKITLYYRVKDGYDPRWYSIEAPDATTKTGTNCIKQCDLYPNQTVYETYIHTETADGEYNSDMREFITPMLPEPEIYNCQNFGYLTELLCQSILKLYQGNKTIYANECTQEACDPESQNPTQAALWSRALRFMHALSCLLCEMSNARFTNSKEGQYLVGEAGWTDILTQIDENDTDNGWKLATSDAVKRYILDKLHNVWHFHDAVDYLVATKNDLNNLPGDATSAIVATENKVYRKQGGNWVASTAEDDKVDNMGVWHINYESTTTGGGKTYSVKAGSAWYFWNGLWQPMDSNIDELSKIVDTLWSKRTRPAVNETGAARMHINAVDRLQYNCASLPSGERWVTMITEPLNVPPPGYYEVSFETGDNATIIQPQQVLSGATAQRPANPTRIGYVFSNWVNKANNATYNWSAPVTSNLVIKAVWNPQPITITFDLNGGSGTTPAPIGMYYGGTISNLPTDANFSRTGYHFLGWMRDGVFVTPTTPMVGNTTLKAAWEANIYTITFDGQNDETPLVQEGEYGTQMNKPADAVKADSIFIGWYTQPNGGALVTFPITITQNVTYYAHYVDATYTVSFDSNGGTPVPSQTVPYQGVVTKPTDPTLSNHILEGWYLGTQPYTFGQQVTSSFTLTAHWWKIYNVIFNLNGGTGNVPTQTVIENDYATEPTPPTREGYDFLGWFVAGDDTPFDFGNTLITSNLLLEAHWEEIEEPEPTE